MTFNPHTLSAEPEEKEKGKGKLDVTNEIHVKVPTNIDVPTQRKVTSLITAVAREPHVRKDGSRLAFPEFSAPKSSPASLRSFTSSLRSRKRKLTPVPTLESLPFEIKSQIFRYLSQETLRCLTLTSAVLSEAAAVDLYEWPNFASTYRFAQFVTTVSHSLDSAQLVRVLDLSGFGSEAEDTPIAGWREWKYRTEPLYSIHQHTEFVKQTESESSLGLQKLTSHPKSNPFLQQWSTCQDVPVGGIVHILEACKHIR